MGQSVLKLTGSLKRDFLIGMAVAAGLLILYGPGFLRWAELKARRDHLQAEIAALQEENQGLSEEIRRLREDPSYAEALYRRELGVVRPGETMVKFRSQNSNGKRTD